MNKRRMFFLFLIVLFLTPLYASLVLIEGRDIRISAFRGHFADSIIGESIDEPCKIKSGESYAYFLACDSSTIIHMKSFTTLEYYPDMKTIVLNNGVLSIISKTKIREFCHRFELEKGSIRYAGEDSIDIAIDDTLRNFKKGQIFTSSGIVTPQSIWYRRLLKDSQYLIELAQAGKIPSAEYDLDYPSRRRKLLSYGTSGAGGISTYEDDRYYYGSLVWRMRFWELKFAYDFWFAFREDGAFYDDAWDEWSDLISHIEYVQLFERNDPFYLRIGLLENLNYGSGLIMSNYNNAVFLPFDRLAGIESRFSLSKARGGFFVNDISYPRVFGAETEFEISDRFSLKFAYAGDIDLFANINDSDKDSYPDKLDPQPNEYNYETDSIIVDNDVQSFDDFDQTQLHVIETGASYDFIKKRDLTTTVSGAIAMHSEIGSGISLPNLKFSYRWLSLSAGADLQSPGFKGWVFGRNYESDKARFIQDEDSNLVLTTTIDELEKEKDWLYGWNNSIRFRVPRFVDISSRYRDVYRGDFNDRNFSLKIENRYPFSDVMIKSAVFIDNHNFDRLFGIRNNGSSWGAEVEFRAHQTVKVKVRYRELYEDRNSNNVISSSEIERNFDGSVTVDFDYWWEKFVKWYKTKRLEKKQESVIEEESG